jgi:hypothetical protein
MKYFVEMTGHARRAYGLYLKMVMPVDKKISMRKCFTENLDEAKRFETRLEPWMLMRPLFKGMYRVVGIKEGEE